MGIVKEIYNTFRNVLAICIAILPINIYMIWYRLTQTERFSTVDMLIYPLIFGCGSILLIILLNKYLIKDTFNITFNSGDGVWYKDVMVGIGLTLIYFALFFITRHTLMQWIPRNNPPNTELINVLIDLANNPLLMIAWFVPVLWIGIALYEEMSRVFLLKCLWNISDNKYWEITVIFLASVLVGSVHIYQGFAGAISIGIKSVIMCLYFYKYRRLLPLVISHGLFDGLQFALIIVQIRQ